MKRKLGRFHLRNLKKMYNNLNEISRQSNKDTHSDQTMNAKMYVYSLSNDDLIFQFEA